MNQTSQSQTSMKNPGETEKPLCLHEGGGRVHSWPQIAYDPVTTTAYVPLQVWPEEGEYYNYCRPYDISRQLPQTAANIPVGSAHARDAHNQTTLGIDASGYLHAAYGAHVSPVFYRRSVAPHDKTLAEGFEDERELPLDAHTYPRILCHPENPQDIVILARRGPAWDAPNSGISMIRSRDGGRQWEAPRSVISDLTGAGYFGATIDYYGQIHLAFTPRQNKGGSFQERSRTMWGPLYYLKSKNMGDSWETESGEPLGSEEIPARTALQPIVKGNRIISVNGNIIHDTSGNPLIAYSDYSEHDHAYYAQLHLARWDGNDWQLHQITEEANVNGFSITCDCSNILRVYGTLDNPFEKHPHTNVMLYVSEDLGMHWTPRPALQSSEKIVTYAVGRWPKMAAKNIAAWTVGASPLEVERILLGPA